MQTTESHQSGHSWDGKLVTYNQEKAGLTPIYIKRKVCDDGYSTIPLEL